MTREEMAQIKGATLTELRETEEELACLECKAFKMTGDLEMIGQVLQGEQKGDCKSGYFIVQPTGGSKRIDLPTIQDMHGIIIGRDRLGAEVARLEQSLKNMGH